MKKSNHTVGFLEVRKNKFQKKQIYLLEASQEETKKNPEPQRMQLVTCTGIFGLLCSHEFCQGAPGPPPVTLPRVALWGVCLLLRGKFCSSTVFQGAVFALAGYPGFFLRYIFLGFRGFSGAFFSSRDSQETSRNGIYLFSEAASDPECIFQAPRNLLDGNFFMEALQMAILFLSLFSHLQQFCLKPLCRIGFRVLSGRGSLRLAQRSPVNPFGIRASNGAGARSELSQVLMVCRALF